MSSDYNYPGEIKDFYKGRNVFITGGTGFVGKAIIEKLLRTCPDIGNIYALVRPKRGKEVAERAKDMKNDRIMQWLKKDNAGQLDKIIAIAGDVSSPSLGISDEDRQTLIHEVSVIIHSAATVRFNEPLKVAVQINLTGVKCIVELAKQMVQLDALVHISTAYANSHCYGNEERVYTPLVDPDALAKFVETVDPATLNTLENKMIGNCPNTYTYTKHLAEIVIEQEHGHGLPVIIVRPGAVSASLRDPKPGWLDSFAAANGIFAELGRGTLRSWLATPNYKLALVPLDITVNAAIVAAADVHWRKPDDLFVVNVVTPGIKFTDIRREVLKTSREFPSKYTEFYPNYVNATSMMKHRYDQCVYQMLPAYIKDVFSRLVGRNPMAVRIAKRSKAGVDLVEFFTNTNFDFKIDNLRVLERQLCDKDKGEYPLDMTNLNMNEYVKTYMLGIRQYLLKDDMSSLPEAKKKLKRLRMLQIMLKSMKLVIYLGVIYKVSNYISKGRTLEFIVRNGTKMIEYAKTHMIPK